MALKAKSDPKVYRRQEASLVIVGEPHNWVDGSHPQASQGALEGGRDDEGRSGFRVMSQAFVLICLRGVPGRGEPGRRLMHVECRVWAGIIHSELSMLGGV